MSLNINSLHELLRNFYPRPSKRAYIGPAALMGPDDHRRSGGRAAYGSLGQRCSGRAESLSHVPPGLRALEKAPHAPARAKSRDRACGEPHFHTGKHPDGRTTRPGLPFNGQTGNGAWRGGGLGGAPVPPLFGRLPPPLSFVEGVGQTPRACAAEGGSLLKCGLGDKSTARGKYSPSFSTPYQFFKKFYPPLPNQPHNASRVSDRGQFTWPVPSAAHLATMEKAK
jgi:hypothetical protein